ncbi:MAG TPA: helix-turn-helix transcriptional regulator [Umezawaea sp.]|nr:helix-turn-helix transcriptional regulator [Umezawaea sp.]
MNTTQPTEQDGATVANQYDHTPSVEVGMLIRLEMTAKKKTRAALAEHLGVSTSSLSRRFMDQQVWDINELADIARFLGTPLTMLCPDRLAFLSDGPADDATEES